MLVQPPYVEVDEESPDPLFQKPSLLLTENLPTSPLRKTASSLSTTVFIDGYASDGRSIETYPSDDDSELTEPELISLSSESDNEDHDDDEDNDDNISGDYNYDNASKSDREDVGSDTGSVGSNKELLDALPAILSKFDALFPFYRLSDKDCKKLSLLVFNEINKIHKIFCNAHGRSLQVIIYYYNNPQKPKNIFFYNNDDNEKEVESWNDINMDKNYQKLELLKQFRKYHSI